jgi:Family of unknown function (DUF6491)
MKTKHLCAALLSLLCSTSAFAAGSCLRQSQIYNWNALDDRTLIVEDDFHNKFKLGLLSPCLNIKFKLTLAFKTFGGTALSCVTKGDEVLTGSPIGPQHCPIVKIEPYTAEMEKADKDAAAAAKAEKP